MLPAHEDILSIQLVTNNKYARQVRSCAAGFRARQLASVAQFVRALHRAAGSIPAARGPIVAFFSTAPGCSSNKCIKFTPEILQLQNPSSKMLAIPR